MIDAERYLRVHKYIQKKPGGQELIIGEILGLMRAGDRVWMPYGRNKFTDDMLTAHGHTVSSLGRFNCNVLYFGTPTIVDGKALFGEIGWNVEKEREAVEEMVKVAEDEHYRAIISGLGSGDVGFRDRRAAQGEGTTIVCMKAFDEFTDYVFYRELRHE